MAIEALEKRLCLALVYARYQRVVEVHAIGTTRSGRTVMSAYQVAGQSNSSPVPGWRMFRLDECLDVALSDIPSQAPRPGYQRGSGQFVTLDAQL